ncbi:MAG: MFS transporter [Aeromicrobium sp.]|uniref:MFS transporter n=1 Tax=Aeromicrobium sp. TaxID=1871063 RepID=UPI003C3DFDCB
MLRRLDPGRLFVGSAIVLLALNLRALVGSVGVVLDAVRSDLDMSTTVAGVVTTLPVICFAVAGLWSGGVVRRLGLHRSTVLLLVLIFVGLVVRAATSSTAVFLLASTIALVGAAVGNVLLPPLAKRHFPDRLPLISALYGAALMGGVAASSLTTVPIASAFGGWRQGLGAWAVLAGVTLIPWVVLWRDRDVASDRPRVSYLSLMRTPVAWALVGVFGVQSAQAYAQFGWFPAIMVDAGLSRSHAGALLGLLAFVGLPVTLLLPWLMRRAGAWPVLPWFFAAVTAIGWIGVLATPTSVPWLWAILLGLGSASFTWTLTMIGQRAASPESTAALSGFVQGLGYLVAGVGPFGAGYLRDLTGSWDLPVMMLLVGASLIGVFGAWAMRAEPVD